MMQRTTDTINGVPGGGAVMHTGECDEIRALLDLALERRRMARGRKPEMVDALSAACIALGDAHAWAHATCVVLAAREATS